ncbi:hypothetical protein ACJJTC_001565 [Scirpophaga incertulas]
MDVKAEGEAYYCDSSRKLLEERKSCRIQKKISLKGGGLPTKNLGVGLPQACREPPGTPSYFLEPPASAPPPIQGSPPRGRLQYLPRSPPPTTPPGHGRGVVPPGSP